MQHPTDDDLDYATGYLLAYVALRLRIGLRRTFLQADQDITAEQWAVLLRLGKRQGLTQSELSERTVKDKTTVTRILDKLEAKGLAERRRSPDDRRCQRLFLTPLGEETLHTLTPLTRRYGTAVFSDFSPSDRKTLREFLLRLERRLDGLIDTKENA